MSSSSPSLPDWGVWGWGGGGDSCRRSAADGGRVAEEERTRADGSCRQVISAAAAPVGAGCGAQV